MSPIPIKIVCAEYVFCIAYTQALVFIEVTSNECILQLNVFDSSCPEEEDNENDKKKKKQKKQNMDNEKLIESIVNVEMYHVQSRACLPERIKSELRNNSSSNHQQSNLYQVFVETIHYPTLFRNVIEYYVEDCLNGKAKVISKRMVKELVSNQWQIHMDTATQVCAVYDQHLVEFYHQEKLVATLNRPNTHLSGSIKGLKLMLLQTSASHYYYLLTLAHVHSSSTHTTFYYFRIAKTVQPLDKQDAMEQQIQFYMANNDRVSWDFFGLFDDESYDDDLVSIALSMTGKHLIAKSPKNNSSDYTFILRICSMFGPIKSGINDENVDESDVTYSFYQYGTPCETIIKNWALSTRNSKNTFKLIFSRVKCVTLYQERQQYECAIMLEQQYLQYCVLILPNNSIWIVCVDKFGEYSLQLNEVMASEYNSRCNFLQ